MLLYSSWGEVITFIYLFILMEVLGTEQERVDAKHTLYAELYSAPPLHAALTSGSSHLLFPLPGRPFGPLS